MNRLLKNSTVIITLILLLFLLLLFDISFGQVSIPFIDVINAIFGKELSNESWQYIIVNYRLPKAITAILVGFGLSISGLLMQTLFRNPLAGPYVLGLSSGSSLGVALVIMGASFLPSFLADIFVSNFGIILASCLGSFLVFLLILAVSVRLRDTASILIVGLMFSSFSGAMVSALSFLSSAEQLQKFTFWSMGNIGNLSWNQVLILSIFIFIGLLLSFINIKALDALLLGQNYAASLGVNFKRVQFIIIFATSILTGCITAFVGPIAFVGMAVPHIAKLVFQTSNHFVLFFGTLLFGAMIMLLCDVISQFPGTDIVMPINVITSVFGAPIVIYLLLKKRNLS